ncbi:MAG: thiamine-phosphate kinase [Bacteroidetes bacterium CG_4_10_14_3_um_filter_31_20]|nr:MAG: thiamine-phosphate kinase [Bacteroidetes bacterium CG_4_10_14_3_um_filter_31_20]
MKSENDETQISELGEFGLIEHLTKSIKIKNGTTIKGIGDDAAVLDYNNKKILVTTDLLVEGIHFNLIYTPLKHLGYKAVVVNLSDICAMNGVPRQITVSIAISKKFTVEAIEELYEGIRLACEKYGIDLIGGDTSSSLTGLLISVTAIGEANETDIVYRSGAKVNDLICVSGDLGAAYMGLQLLEREKYMFTENSKIQPDFSGHEYILERQLKPEPRIDIIKKLTEINVKPTSMIDISDGLSSELMHICKNSNVGCKIYSEKIPIDITTCNMANEFNIAPEIAALNGGEDYELLFTVSLKDYEKIKNLKEISVIGNIIDESDGMNLISDDGKQIPITAQGWNGIK